METIFFSVSQFSASIMLVPHDVWNTEKSQAVLILSLCNGRKCRGCVQSVHNMTSLQDGDHMSVLSRARLAQTRKVLASVLMCMMLKSK